jgi:hypothetical protein
MIASLLHHTCTTKGNNGAYVEITSMGSPTVPMHKICQAKVHAVFTETEQKNYYHTVERLQEHEEIAKFIKWVSKKEPEFFDTSIKKK